MSDQGGGTVGQDAPAGDLSLAEESRRAARCRALLTARIALDVATKAGISARVHFDALRESYQRDGFAPTEAELAAAYREIAGGGAQGAPQSAAPKIVTS